MTTAFWLQTLRVIHVYGAIVLVGFIAFNTLILQPALKRIPPAHSTVVSQKIGAGLMWFGTGAIVLLGISGFARLYLMGSLGRFFTWTFISGPYGRWIFLMVVAWSFLVVTGALSAYWYTAVLTKKMQYSAGLRDLEKQRAAQERVNAFQDRLYYANVVAALLAALGGAMAKF